MANLVVTSTTNSIKVDFGVQIFFDRMHGITFSKATWSKSEIASIRLVDSNLFVFVDTKDGIHWKVSQNGYSGTFTIDTVDGASPSSNSDLYDKLIALIA